MSEPKAPGGHDPEALDTVSAGAGAPDSRQRLRRSALRLYATRGPEGASVREIASDARLAPGLIRHHFGSKAGLTRAVDDQVLGTISAVLDRIPLDDEPQAVVAARDRAFASVLREQPEIAGYLRWCLIAAESEPDGLLDRLADLTLSETRRLHDHGIGASRDLRLSALRTLLRQIGSLVVQPVADRLWDRLGTAAPDHGPGEPAPRIVVSLPSLAQHRSPD